MSAKWHKGPPPSVGWWPTSASHDPVFIRWWNGKFWSLPSTKELGAAAASVRALQRCNKSIESRIEWTDRPKSWPARSKT